MGPAGRKRGQQPEGSNSVQLHLILLVIGSVPRIQLQSGLLQQQASPYDAVQLWGKPVAEQLSPMQPQRPVPTLLVVLGLILMALWGGLLALALTSAGSVALVILAIVLSPIVLLGLLLFIGGLIVALSGGKAKKQPAAPVGS
jgi:hypothetical protein